MQMPDIDKYNIVDRFLDGMKNTAKNTCFLTVFLPYFF